MIADSRSYGKITTFFTDREDGVSKGSYASFNMGYFSGDDRAAVDRNRALLSDHFGIEADRLVVPNEVHGAKVMVVDEASLKIPSEERNDYFKCDALVTNLRRVCLGVTVADCVPVLLFDEQERVVAASHAGWKGVVAGVLSETLSAMKRMAPVAVERLHAEIWPSISYEHFEVGEEVVDKFSAVFSKEEMGRFVVRTGFAKPHINLREAVRLQLLSLGLRRELIWSHDDCTYSQSKYFSARRDGFASGRMVAGILME